MGSTVFYDGAAELATITNTFRVNGTATDPTTVTLAVTDPSGTTSTYTYAAAEITKSSTGVYTKDIACTSVGTWAFRWIGTGTASDVEAGTWEVKAAPGADLYCTPEQLKSRTGISDSYDAAEMLGACRAASRWIDEYCDRVFARRTVTQEFEAPGYYCLPVPDLVSVTTLKTDDDADGVFENTWATSDYELQPVNADVQLEPLPFDSIAAIGSRLFPVARYAVRRRHRVQIVGVFGWPSLPAPVAEAAAILAGDFLALGGMKFGVAGFGDFAIRAKMSSPALDMLAPYRWAPIKVG